MELLIEGSDDTLEYLREGIHRELGREAQLEPVTSLQEGEFREPILVGLIIALSPAIVEVVGMLLKHREEMARIQSERQSQPVGSEVTLRVLEGESEREVTLDALRDEIA